MKYSDDETVKQARSNIYTTYSCYTSNPTEERGTSLQIKIREYQKIYILLIFGEELNHKVTLIEKSNRTNKHQENWKIINKSTRRKTTKRATLKEQNKEERVKHSYNYFKELLGKPRKITDQKQTVNRILDNSDLNIKTGHVTNSEYEQVRKQIKENKAPGLDDINPEVLKQCEINNVINFANTILINNEEPTKLGESDIIPMPKQNYLSLQSNHHGISLSSLVTKVINQIHLN